MASTRKGNRRAGAKIMRMAADALRRLREASDRLARHTTQAEQARHELHEALLEAADAGVDNGTLAKVSGYSRQRVAQILSQRR